MSDPRAKRLIAGSLAAGFVLHTAAALLVWARWRQGARGVYLVWMDLPLSLLWAGEAGRALLAWSLTVGGAWWAAVTALLAFGVGHLARPSAGASIPGGRRADTKEP